jgi:hypothetical protein
VVSHDKHRRVQRVPIVLPKEERDPLEEPPIDDETRAHLLRHNCGFEKVERLERNIGYVKFNFFWPPGAHPTAVQRVDDHFLIGVPFAGAINPISKTSWEGEGIEPDVKVPADQALDVAKELAAATVDR